MAIRDAFTTPEDMGERQRCLQPHRGVSDFDDPTDAVIPSCVFNAGEVSSISLPGPLFSDWYSSDDIACMVAGMEVMT